MSWYKFLAREDDSITPATVGSLIEHLKTLDPAMPIAYSCCSEMTVLDLRELSIVERQKPRADGWVHDMWPGLPYAAGQKYLAFPGN